MLAVLIPVLADVAKALLPSLLQFVWEKAHEPTTVEEAAPDEARRRRLLAAVRLRGANR
jgi:hypothetical protein